ncbi:MAG TPA: hypothetical protein VLN48_23265 [Bryobacteraceae bacterium]|nr:hypothetical protein [Bryobacteraceae bacterium]
MITGLLFMLLPGTFLGVWNLISISSQKGLSSLSASWLQAHGHAQIFGWIGTFIIGIGYYSLSKMGTIAPFALSRGWLSWCLWTCGVALRWVANVSLWNWRILLPLSAGAELAAFLIFFVTVSTHRSGGERRRIEAWMVLVIASTVGFLILLLLNAATVARLAMAGDTPEFPHGLDQRFLVLATWGFPVLAVWGFNARWLPAFMGLKPALDGNLLAGLAWCGLGVIAALAGYFHIASAFLIIASVTVPLALNIFERAQKPPLLQGVHPAFPVFIRFCYVWLVIASLLSAWASSADRNGGIWGASRHALTVGFLAGMIFAIGPRILPAFCGERQLYSPRLMFAACSLINLGCLLRVSSEIPAYEGFAQGAWRVLPYSAVVELIAVSLFALNLALTFANRATPAQDSRLYTISFSKRTT